MKKIMLYNPGISSLNLGDSIIAESAKKEIGFLLEDSFVIEVSSHLPQSFYYTRHLKDSDFKFVLGSNLLKSTFFGFKRQWDIELLKCRIGGPVILVGAGWWQYGNKPNFYTRLLLKAYLSKGFMHSVRDEYTKNVLNSIGITNVVNTSCPTMWSLTREHCEGIKRDKASRVIFTLTDYNQDYLLDKQMINTLIKNYDEVVFWPQSIGDFNYFKCLDINHQGIRVILPNLESYNSELKKSDIDYVGTRLHAGIRALQNKVRTLIIGVDNRAVEKNKDFKLPVLHRNEISSLCGVINNTISQDVVIPTDVINNWKQQFL